MALLPLGCLRSGLLWLRHPPLLLAALLLLFSPGCDSAGERSPENRPDSRPTDSRPLVVASFTVLADMGREVSCGLLRVESIPKPGAQIHGYEVTPSDLRRAHGARLVLENGLGLDAWTRRFTARLGDVPHLEASAGVEPLPIAGSTRPNPHAWMSPKAALIYVTNLEQGFRRLDPAHAADYQRCAEAYRLRLRRLDTDLEAALRSLPASQRLLATCEGAFSYLARDYGLEEAWLWPVNGEGEVTPRRMGRMIRTVRWRQVPAVFCETTVDSRIQERVARESGARFGGRFHVDSTSGPEGPAATYEALMRHNLAILVAGLRPHRASPPP